MQEVRDECEEKQSSQKINHAFKYSTDIQIPSPFKAFQLLCISVQRSDLPLQKLDSSISREYILQNVIWNN